MESFVIVRNDVLSCNTWIDENVRSDSAICGTLPYGIKPR
jgi:hypothetical protein